jgi:hypothetical protein
MLAGEIFVCLDEALAQAPRFRATWQNELFATQFMGFFIYPATTINGGSAAKNEA